MAEEERNPTTEHPVAERYRQHRDIIENDLAAVIRFHLRTAPWKFVLDAYYETGGAFGQLLIEEEATRRPVVVKGAEHLHLHLATVGQPTQ